MELYFIIEPIKRVLFKKQVLKVSVELGKSVKVPRELNKVNILDELVCCNDKVFLQTWQTSTSVDMVAMGDTKQKGQKVGITNPGYC